MGNAVLKAGRTLEYQSDIKSVSADGLPKNLYVTLGIGQVEYVDFAERSTSGYLWSIKGSFPSWIDLSDCSFVGALPGQASCRRFRLTALSSGSGNVDFQLARPWQINDPIATVSIRVSVMP